MFGRESCPDLPRPRIFLPDQSLSSWPIGPIIAAVIAGVYGDKAVRMKALIDSIKDLITSGDAQLRADKLVYSDLGFMKVSLSVLYHRNPCR